MEIKHLENGAYLADDDSVYNASGTKLKGEGPAYLSIEQLAFGVEHKECLCAMKRQEIQRTN